MGKFLTPEQVAAIWQVKLPTVWRWIREGRLPATPVGRSYRIREDTVKLGVPKRESQSNSE